jgi:dihydrofolate reductase
MKLSLIVCMSRNGVIGNNRRLPWYIPRDMQAFRRYTMGKPIIMGRKTYDSLGGPLEGRTNIVMTRGCGWLPPGEIIVSGSVNEAVAAAEKTGQPEAVVIGGAQVYAEFIPLCDTAVVTYIHNEFDGDTVFPCNLLKSPEWKLTSQELWTSAPDTAWCMVSHLVLERRRK